MTFQQLTDPAEISKYGSINKAAQRLFLSQSGI
jgi:DNA-binding transcriptional LysR family regulator